MGVDVLGAGVLAAWVGFRPGPWQESVDVRDFVRVNYVPLGADPGGPPPATARLAALVDRAGGEIGDWAADLVIGLPGAVWHEPVPPSQVIAGFEDGSSAAVRSALASHVLTGLPLGGGRVLPDYRRVALYGLGALTAAKRAERLALDALSSVEDVVRRRGQVVAQLRALERLREHGTLAGVDLAEPARTAREAAQWMLLAHTAVAGEHRGAQTAWGRASAFLDVYVERDLAAGTLTAAGAQELVDEVVLTLGLVQRRLPGSPVTVTLGGLGDDGRPLVTATCLRFLHAVEHLSDAPQPDLAVLWSDRLPPTFRTAAAAASLAGTRIDYVGDTLVRASWGDDAAVVGETVTAVRTGRHVLLGGARVNVAKGLLYALNGGRDELTGVQVGPLGTPVGGDVLVFDEVLARVSDMLDWLARTAVDALITEHAVRDRFGYEQLAMSLVDAEVLRSLVCGVVGLAVAADSLAAIRYARVRPVRSTDGLVVDVEVTGDVPRFGNDDVRADELAAWLLRRFMAALREQPSYRGAVHAQALLRPTTADGLVTGATPDRRPAQAPLFAGTGSPSQLVASVASLPYAEAHGGLACPYPVEPAALGATPAAQVTRLVQLVDQAVDAGAYGLVVFLRRAGGPGSHGDGMNLA